MPSIVIAAHNEEAVIGRCLEALLSTATAPELDVTVVANGCTDATAAVARQYPDVRVLELAQAGKPGALNAGDGVARGFPRIYLDADIALRGADVPTLLAALRPPVEAATARRAVDVRGRPLVVRAYFAISSRLPVFDRALFGRGVIAVTESGRSRFTRFPDLVADDLFLDGQFAPEEKRQVDGVVSTVAAPWTTRDLFRRLVRVRAGNASMRAATATQEPATTPAGGAVVATSIASRDSLAFLRVAAGRPALMPAALVYAALTASAALAARWRRVDTEAWGRDESTRTAVLPPQNGAS